MSIDKLKKLRKGRGYQDLFALKESEEISQLIMEAIDHKDFNQLFLCLNYVQNRMANDWAEELICTELSERSE